MLHRECREQAGVIEAVRAGREPDERLRAHLAGCASCREAADAVAWMQRLAATGHERRELPPAATIWWKAQLVRRWESERRASRPIERMQRAEVALGLVSLAALVAWAWPALPAWLARLTALMLPERVPGRLLPLPDVAGQAVVLVLVTLLLGGMLVGFVHRALADE
jgi:predicted anti-sigma-YlaC factor YlaD